ncbi:MAG: NfeD family protein [Verrucomicrobiota bacterium]|nr:NfeD family protein [Verrucomicrobiota bacterium]
MTTVIGIIIISYALIAFEALVPGGILGILGFIGLFIAAYFAHLEFGGWFAPSLCFLVSGLGAIFLIFLEFKWLARSPIGNKIFLGKVVSGSSNQKLSETSLIGEVGKTLTDLHPEGMIQVKAKEYDAFSDEGYLPKGTRIQVVGVDSFRVLVRSHTKIEI